MRPEMKRDRVEAFLHAQMDDAVRVIVITRSGRAFSAEDDIAGRMVNYEDDRSLVSEIPEGHRTSIGTYDGLRRLSQPVNTSLRDMDKLSIAAINGVAIFR